MNYDTGLFGFLNMDSISEQSLCLHDLGIELRQDENYDFNNQDRDYKGYLFQYTLDGCGTFETPDTSYCMTKGKAFFITFPDNSRYYLPPSENSGQYWHHFYLHFSGPAVEPFFKRIQEINGSVITLDFESPSIRLFFELYEALKRNRQLERYQGSEWLYRFLIALLRDVEFPSDQKGSPHVLAALHWMQLHYAKSLNLEAMSKEIGVSFPHLSRLFYKEMGLTPIQYLTQIRLEHAMQLLLNSSLTVQRIAEECGYSSGNYFTKVYKKVLQVTPEEYRRQHKISL